MTKGGFKMEINITTPISREKAKSLKAGDMVKITGVIYTARDAAHTRMLENLHKGIALPVDLKDQTIYFAGPAPAKPNEPIGSVGPTTSYRMDAYSPETIELGLTCMIGKGASRRNEEIWCCLYWCCWWCRCFNKPVCQEMRSCGLCRFRF